jgi:hypothetical protein
MGGHSNEKKGDTFFDSSTAALGTLYTLALLSIIVSILIWG